MIEINDFIFTSRSSTGGTTGSFRIKSKQGAFYQLKPSNATQTYIRQAKANFTNRENYGEIIALRIAQSLFKENKTPEGSLVYDSHSRPYQVFIASKYLEDNKVRKLDDFAREQGIVIPLQKHVRVVSTRANPAKREISINSEPLLSLKQELAEALVNSALLGDHDVNPGNIMILTNEEGHSHAARIDFGHAFNDLLNAPEVMGGRQRKANAIQDFFNRDQIAGVFGDPPKLWRDFRGMVPSKELVKALRQSAAISDVNIENGVENARHEFYKLISKLHQNNDTENLEDLIRSLREIYTNLTGKELKPHNLDAEKTLNKTLDACSRFIKKNRNDCEQVAELMDFQLRVEEHLKHHAPLPANYIESIGHKIGKTEWVRIHKDMPPFVGSVKEYIAHRRHEFVLAENNTYSFKKRLSSQKKQVQVSTPFIKEELEHDLRHYINTREREFFTNPFGKYQKAHKQQAAEELLAAVTGHSNTIDSRFLSALNDGRLGRIVKSYVERANVHSITELVQKLTKEDQSNAPRP